MRLDGTHIHTYISSDIVVHFRGRKLNSSQNHASAIVYFELRFIYVFACWESSAHDALVF